MPRGQKHLIECHCILPQYRRSSNTVYHKFVVFSVIDDSDTVEVEIAKDVKVHIVRAMVADIRSKTEPVKK